MLALLLSVSAVAGGVVAGPAAGAATAVPKCSFNGGALPVVMNVKAGSVIKVACTGLTPTNPYLVLQASLLIGIDPQAKALLSGNSGLSAAALTAALAALPKINPASLTTKLSDSAGKLAFDYTVPSSQAPDPNATCPPSRVQFNSGLIGCALAMIDLVTQKPVGAGSGVLEYVGFSFLPPSPTLALSAKKVAAGQTITVRDAPGATTFWWLSTLASLNNLLTGGTSLPKVTVALGAIRHPVMAVSNVVAAPASYSNSVFTPPKLSGTFKVPLNLHGGKRVRVSVVQVMLGLPLTNYVDGKIKIS
jgi:hypothetical protein